MSREILDRLRKKIEFLNLIPDDIYFNLDTEEFLEPDEEISTARKELEEILGHFIMTYKTCALNKKIPLEHHLCANLKIAVLSKKQREILEEYQRKYQDKKVNFVAYEKPLKLISPEESGLRYFLTDSMT